MRTAAVILLCTALAGCASIPMVVINADSLCRSWRHQTVSKADKLTNATAAGIEGNNRSRPAWGCQPGANRAKSKAKTSGWFPAWPAYNPWGKP